MVHKGTNSSKRRALAGSGTLNRNARKVVDSRFRNMAFFDPEDILQVKYEMLRSVHRDGAPIQKASEDFGFSRITFYKTSQAFKEEGLAGLLPKKKGPRRAHKLNPEVMDYVDLLIEENPKIKISTIRQKLKERFGLTVHKRSIERAIGKGKKKHSKTQND